MTEEHWLASRQPLQMLTYIRPLTNDRALRLFACAASRRVVHMLRDPRSYRAFEVAERFADGTAEIEELNEAAAGALEVANYMARVSATGWNAARTVALAAGEAWAAAARAAEMAADADLVPEVFGNPFRPVPAAESGWAAAGEVVRMARAMYQARSFTDAPLLADALQDAGCADAELLEHLRRPERHYRGCWVIDLILNTR